jgi:hypothetical protein
MEINKIVESICFDHHVASKDVMCKTSVHYHARVKARIAYTLLTYTKLTKYQLANIMSVHHYTIWRYRHLVSEEIKTNPQLEVRLKSYIK